MDRLNERDRAILDFEKQWARNNGSKADRIRRMLGISAARYYQHLNRIIDDPRALAAEPMLVKRLLRLRKERMAARASILF